MFARKLLFKFAIVILVTKVNTQYEAEYRGGDGDDDDEDHSRYSDDSGNESEHPDYSKYYSNSDNKAPLTVPYNGGGGFVSPIEFQSFFPAGGFGFGSASSKQEILKPANVDEDQNSGFVRSDEFKAFSPSDSFTPNYFEKTSPSENSRPIIKNSNYATKPKPTDEDDYDNSEVRDLNKKPKNNKYYKNSNNKPKPTKGGKHSSSYKANKYANPAKPSSYYAAPSYTPQYNRYTQTPYQKYSFQAVQPVAYLSSSPYNPSYSKVVSSGYPASSGYDYQPTEIVSHKIQAKDCTRIEKKLPKEIQSPNRRVRREAMQCYICKDPSTGANFEQCSYSSQPDASKQSFAAGSVEKYSSANGNRYRFKRYSQNAKEPAAGDVVDVDQDPYEYVKAYSGAYKSAEKDDEESPEGDKDYYRSEEYGDSDEYRFGPEFFTDTDSSKEEKSSSEIRSEKLVKDAESCKKVHQGSMTCVVCKNLKTGDNYEQCSYSSEPNEKKYAYVKQKNYNSNNDPGYEEDTDSTQTNPVYKDDGVKDEGKTKLKYKLKRPSSKGDFGQAPRVLKKRQGNSRKGQELDDDNSYSIPKHFTQEVQKPKGSKADYDDHKIDDYHFRVFPEYASKESKKEETRVENPYFKEDTGAAKQDVEEVLADFAKKNRSDCKRVLKNGMTCFLCVDKNGLQNEECMFVSESKPQGSHLAYHEVKEYKTAPQTESGSESKVNVVTQKETKRRKLPKKAVVPLDSTTAVAPPSRSYTIRSKVPRQYRRKNNIATSTTTEGPEVAESKKVERKKVKEDEVEPTLKTPKEFDVHGTEGAFSSETKPVFSKKLGFSLPRFMLEKSPDQLEFEQFEKNG